MGSDILNIDPTPTALDAVKEPPWSWIIFCETDSPSPVPLPGSFVVKNGSKTFCKVSSDMPWPLSFTSMKTDMSSLDVLMVIKPSFSSGIDCAALTIKFNST